MNEMNDKTTKAAKCNKCGNYHTICSLEIFNTDKSVRKDFARLAKKGFDIVTISTEEAKRGFGGC